MFCNSRGAVALLSGISVIALNSVWAPPASAQQTLDAITVVASKTEERAINALAAVSTIRQEELTQLMPKRISDVFFGMPSVNFQDRGDDAGSSINIRGLQDFGRVAVIVDGARQNFQRTGHNANGQFYLEPEMLAAVDVVRGPVANIYGSGAIGGVVSFRTTDVDDVLKPGQRWGVAGTGLAGSNSARGMGSFFAGARPNANVDVFAGVTYRTQNNYKDGRGIEIPNTAQDVGSAIGKFTVRPADGHEVKFTGLTYEANYNAGQPSVPNTSAYETQVRNSTATARWKYARPEDKLFDFDLSTYWNQSNFDQKKIAGTNNPITGPLGGVRNYEIDTKGFDAHNTTRFDFGDVRNAITYGGDHFRDEVDTFDPGATADLHTPSGERTVSGAFVQWKVNYSTWLEMIGAARYDKYELEGGGFTSNGDRTSPKGTVGITPVPWFTVYGTYAEGYRAPAVTETLVNGAHPLPFAAPGALFFFVPNPALRPEVGKTKEIGVNLRGDNVLKQGDSFRGKFNVFRNDLEDFIEASFFGPPLPPLGGPRFFQYRNIPKARIEGFEFETKYDAGDWFAGLAGSWLKGRDLIEGDFLTTIPAHQLATTLGWRFWERKATLAVRWAMVSEQNEVPLNYLPTYSYNLVNVFLGFKPSENVEASFTVDNLLNEYYFTYPIPRSSGGENQGDVLLAASQPGRVFKGSVKISFGAM